MRLISTKILSPGMQLAHPIFNEKGQVLLNKDVVLTDRLVKRLGELNVKYVYIQDKLSEGIEVKETISSTIRREAVQTIESTFLSLQQEKLSEKSFLLDKDSTRFKGIIRTLLSEIKGNEDLLTILSDVYTYDSYIFQHSFNVTLYTLALGMELGLSMEELETLGLGAILHDIGKIMVDEDVLMKPGRLSDHEFEQIKKHANHGFDILRQLHTIPLIVAHCAFQHHERLNGTGYPRGIKGNEMHLYPKIIAVADVFDAVTSNRVYRNAMLPHEGLEILYSGAGTLFDQTIIEAFRRAIAIYPNGMVVKLSDQRVGIVSGQNVGFTERPIVKVIEQDGRKLEHPYEVNLKQELAVVITECHLEYMES